MASIFPYGPPLGPPSHRRGDEEEKITPPSDRCARVAESSRTHRSTAVARHCVPQSRRDVSTFADSAERSSASGGLASCCRDVPCSVVAMPTAKGRHPQLHQDSNPPHSPEWGPVQDPVASRGASLGVRVPLTFPLLG